MANFLKYPKISAAGRLNLQCNTVGGKKYPPSRFFCGRSSNLSDPSQIFRKCRGRMHGCFTSVFSQKTYQGASGHRFSRETPDWRIEEFACVTASTGSQIYWYCAAAKMAVTISLVRSMVCVDKRFDPYSLSGLAVTGPRKDSEKTSQGLWNKRGT